MKLCEEKEKRKQEEEELKAKKKSEREEKALQKKKELEKKAEERKKKQEGRARKKEEEQRRKEERKAERERKRQEKETGHSRKKRMAENLQDIEDKGPSTSESAISEPRPKRTKISKSIPKCALCGTREDSSDAEENWIQCSNCDKWYEESCAKVLIEEVKDLVWFCQTCA